jgi:hypothetical protein
MSGVLAYVVAVTLNLSLAVEGELTSEEAEVAYWMDLP